MTETRLRNLIKDMDESLMKDENMKYKDFLKEEEITASRAALAINASIGSGCGCPDKWVMEYALSIIKRRLKVIKAEQLAQPPNDKVERPEGFAPTLG